MSLTIDQKRLKNLAYKWMEIASLPIMQKRKKMWRDVKDLKGPKPMILIETCTIKEFVTKDDLQCEDPYLRNVEKNMLTNIFQYEYVGDDIVLEPYFHIGWQLDFSDYGVKINKEYANNLNDGLIGYKVEHPIKNPDHISMLKKRTVTVNRKRSLEYKSMLEDIFGNILPVRIINACTFESEPGFSPYLGVNFLFLTYEILELIGNNNFLFWPYDHPDDLNKLSRFLMDDKIRTFKWMEKEGLLSCNTDNHWAGPGSYGYCSDLPATDTKKSVKLTDCWGRTESQESENISPEMFNNLYLPYIAEGCKIFGLVYYGCCERIDDRWEYIKSAIPNLRAVCVSPWNNINKMGEYLGKEYVFSGKTNPAYLSVNNVDWDLIVKELKQIKDAAKNCNLELLIRDLYTISGERKRLKKWVELTKKVFDM
jgi:hypothetical protein